MPPWTVQALYEVRATSVRQVGASRAGHGIPGALRAVVPRGAGVSVALGEGALGVRGQGAVVTGGTVACWGSQTWGIVREIDR